ncbi:hypothetical protein ACKWTF_001338 [Chironomus riparius]
METLSTKTLRGGLVKKLNGRNFYVNIFQVQIILFEILFNGPFSLFLISSWVLIIEQGTELCGICVVVSEIFSKVLNFMDYFKAELEINSGGSGMNELMEIKIMVQNEEVLNCQNCT